METIRRRRGISIAASEIARATATPRVLVSAGRYLFRRTAVTRIAGPRFREIASNQYREAVTGRLPRGTRVKVLLRNEKGKAVLDFKGIPVEQVSQLAAALTGELPPVREVFVPQKTSVG